MLRTGNFRTAVVAPWQKTLSCTAGGLLRPRTLVLPAPARGGTRRVLELRMRFTRALGGRPPLPASPLSVFLGPSEGLRIPASSSRPSRPNLRIARVDGRVSFRCSSASPTPLRSLLSNPPLWIRRKMTTVELAISGGRRKRKSGGPLRAGEIPVRAVAGAADSLATDVAAPSKTLYEELQRYGVDESDYNCTAVPQQQSKLPFEVKKQRTRKTDDVRKRNAASAAAAAAAELAVGGDVVREQQQQRPTLKQESGVVEDWCAYLLLSADMKKTYVGVTYDITRRLRQHNGEIAGGAKSARAGRPWRLVCTVRGFASRSEACQFEWTWKSTAAKIKSIALSGSEANESPLVTRRRATLAKVLESNDEWTSLECHWHSE